MQIFDFLMGRCQVETWTDMNTIIKFADDTAVVRLVIENNEKVYLKEGEDLTCWCRGIKSPPKHQQD